MLMSVCDILTPAKRFGYAVGAFNVTESTMFKAIVESAEELESPAIIQVSPNEFDFCDVELYRYFAERLQRSLVPFALHYDHGKTYEGCIRAIRAGFTSVMFDGSALSYEENVARTLHVAEVAHAAGVSIEGEIGFMGEITDFKSCEVSEATLTDPEIAANYARRTGVDALAVSIGTVHGLVPSGYKPKLDVELVARIARRVKVPLVMHGGSCMPDDQVREACRNGINKVNVSSEFKRAYYVSASAYVAAHPAAASPTAIVSDAVGEVRRIVREKILLFGCAGKAGDAVRYGLTD